MQAIRPVFHRAFALVLVLLLALTLLPLETLAVSGNEVAADGVYTSIVTAQKYKKISWTRPTMGGCLYTLPTARSPGSMYRAATSSPS